jgi:hypothetical protein
VPSALPYGLLTQKHPEYDAPRYGQIEDLYEGGWRIMRKAPEYLPKLALEHGEQYTARCKTASYQPYFGQILDQFVSDLFTQELTIQPASDADNPNTPGDYPDKDFYTGLARNIDGNGTTMLELAGDILTTALKHQWAYLMVDAPDVAIDKLPDSLAEEDALGARRCYAYEIPPDQVIDWKWDQKLQTFTWVILATREQERASPGSDRKLVTEKFTVWQASETAASWVRYAITYDPATDAPRPETMVQSEAEGTTNFPRIPLMRFEMPKGLWVGNKIGPQALEHWRRRSALIGAENRSCVAIPFATLGPELPAIGESTSEAQEDPHRGRDPVRQFEQRGFLALGKDDGLDFAEPKGHAYEIIDKQIDALREGMYAVNHQMAAGIRPTTSALGRSGLSKQKDEDHTVRVLGALGRLVRAFWVRVYETIAKARKEDVIWVAHGLDSYEKYDREQVIDEGIKLKAMDIPSPTARKEHIKRWFKIAVPGLPPATYATVDDEIDEGVDAEEELRQLQQKAQADAIKNPPPPGTVAPKPAAPPNGKPIGAAA